MRILFTGGGTGGHIYPIAAVAEEIKNLSFKQNINVEMRYFGAVGPYRNLLEANNIKTSSILSSKIRRYFDIRNVFDIFKFFFSIPQSLWKVFWYMPDVLFSKGGPGALVVVMACWFYRVPIIIHESDAIPGLTSRLSSRFAKRISISFASAAQFFKNKSVALVGNPIRRTLLQERQIRAATRGLLVKTEIGQPFAKQTLGFNPDKPLILALGGSQGSSRINAFFLDISGELAQTFQVLHQVGVKNFQQIKSEFDAIKQKRSEEEKRRYKIVPYLEDDIKEALIAADVVVARAGSGTIFEIAAFGKPAILIPLTGSAGNHQVANAYEYAKTGAANVVEETNLKPNIFMLQLKKIFEDQNQYKTMSENAKKFSKPEAAQKVAEEILRLANRG